MRTPPTTFSLPNRADAKVVGVSMPQRRGKGVQATGNRLPPLVKPAAPGRQQSQGAISDRDAGDITRRARRTKSGSAKRGQGQVPNGGRRPSNARSRGVRVGVAEAQPRAEREAQAPNADRTQAQTVGAGVWVWVCRRIPCRARNPNPPPDHGLAYGKAPRSGRRPRRRRKGIATGGRAKPGRRREVEPRAPAATAG